MDRVLPDPHGGGATAGEGKEDYLSLDGTDVKRLSLLVGAGLWGIA